MTLLGPRSSAFAGVLGSVAGALGSRAGARLLSLRPPGGNVRWVRTNAAGASVTLLEGPAYVVGALSGLAVTTDVPARARSAAMRVVTGAGALGAYDDLQGSGDARGFGGHLRALRHGQVTTGSVKILGIGLTGLACGALLRDDALDVVLAGGVIAGSANLANLLDLRPGRALKVALAVGGPLVLRDDRARGVLAGPLGAAVGVLPDDLGARSMLGDCGANALGAVVGVAAAAGCGRRELAGALAVLVALTAASERVSFTRVIESTPGLRELDRLGRRTA